MREEITNSLLALGSIKDIHEKKNMAKKLFGEIHLHLEKLSDSEKIAFRKEMSESVNLEYCLQIGLEQGLEEIG